MGTELCGEAGGSLEREGIDGRKGGRFTFAPNGGETPLVKSMQPNHHFRKESVLRTILGKWFRFS